MKINTKTFEADGASLFVWVGILFIALSMGLKPASAQVLLTTNQLDELVSRIALYPDPLLAQVLVASSYSDQIPLRRLRDLI